MLPVGKWIILWRVKGKVGELAENENTKHWTQGPILRFLLRTQ